jgi:thiamine-phosphate pyrophosphorylase
MTYANIQHIDWGLYAILDKTCHNDRSVTALVEAVIQGGAGIVQLRDKISCADTFYADAIAARSVTDHFSIPLVINDRVDIAMAADADGVHLGQNDLPFAVARQLIGPDKLLGASVHDVQEFESALSGNPDYFGVGTIYNSQTKRQLRGRNIRVLIDVRAQTDLPIVGIGGITVKNLAPVIEAGADGVAVISDLFNTKSVRERAKEFVEEIKSKKQQ